MSQQQALVFPESWAAVCPMAPSFLDLGLKHDALIVVLVINGAGIIRVCDTK